MRVISCQWLRVPVFFSSGTKWQRRICDGLDQQKQPSCVVFFEESLHQAISARELKIGNLSSTMKLGHFPLDQASAIRRVSEFVPQGGN